MRTPRSFDVALLCCVMLTQVGSPRSWPPCPSPHNLAEAIERLLARPWTELSVEEVLSEWPVKPEQRPCALLPCSNWGEALLTLDQWCRRCGITAEPVGTPFRETPLTIGVDAHLWAPDPATRDANVALLVRAMHAPRDAMRQDGNGWQVWRWTQGTMPMGLQVRRLGELDGYGAHLELRSCTPPSSFEAVQLDSATLIHLYRPPWAAEMDSERGELWVRYYTDCSIRDVACLREEVKRFWPHFRDEAERQRKSTVWFSYADCFGLSSAVSYQRASAGAWTDPWSSRTSECGCSTR